MSKIKKYISDRVLPRVVVLAIDLAMVIFSCFFVFILRYGFTGLTIPAISRNVFLLSMIVMGACFISFSVFRTYRGILRFSSFTDLMKIVYALTLGYIISYVVVFFLHKAGSQLDLTLIIALPVYAVNLLIMLFSRVLVKQVYEHFFLKRELATNVFVYGTRKMGVNIARALQTSPDSNYRVLGFISDENQMVGKEVWGVRVYANDDYVIREMLMRRVKTLVVSPHKFDEIKKCNELNKFIDAGITLLTTSPVDSWANKKSINASIKDVQIEDLLPRDPIHVNMREIASNLEGKRVLITGAAGSIGSEIVRQVAMFNPYSIVLVDQAETPLHNMRLEIQNKWRNLNAEIVVADIANKTRMEKVFQQTRPQYIFHAAAYKHVPMMEDNVSESIQNNVQGTKILADLAVEFNVDKFVMVSTDKAVNPSNVMGCSKRICEIYVQSLARHLKSNPDIRTQFITTRFGNVLGSNGSVIPLFREQIRKGGPVTVTHPEIIRYFMTIPEACQLVLEAGAMGNGGEIYIFDMGEPVKILDLAERMIKLLGADVQIVFTGLRHGEKLYEELLATTEHTKPTHHEKIMIADVREYDYNEVNDKISKMITDSFAYDDMKTVKHMKELVPEFKSINSPYESIDKMLEKRQKIAN